MKKVSIEPCCQKIECCPDKVAKKGTNSLKKAKNVCPGCYDYKKKENAITQLQSFLNKPTKRKLTKPTKRTRQLALPKLRKLLNARQDYNHIINDKQRETYFKLIKRSMFTIYTGFGKPTLPPKKDHYKWSEEDWRLHEEWLKVRAKPKVILMSKPIKRKRVPLETLLPTCVQLAIPKSVSEFFYDDKVGNFCDPITKPKVSGSKIDYETDPWYQYLNTQLTKLKAEGMEKRKEIEELRNPKPLPPLKKACKKNVELEVL